MATELMNVDQRQPGSVAAGVAGRSALRKRPLTVRRRTVLRGFRWSAPGTRHTHLETLP